MTRYDPGDHDIELVSGDYLDLADPDPAVITLDVVAHGLSNVCRYGGHTRRFYSVAEHACLVAAKLGSDGHPLSYQLAGLHHDDAEAFVADIPRPLKTLLQPAYGEISDRLDAIIGAVLGVPLPVEGSAMEAAVRGADDWALAAEAYYLMPSRGRGWWCDGLYAPGEEDDLLQGGLGCSPGDAYETFVERHRYIVARRERAVGGSPE